MELTQLHFLITAEGQHLLQETAKTPINDNNHLQIADRLRRKVGPALAQAVTETVLLRQRAAGKFSHASQMFFTRPALEQASSEIIAAYRARRFIEAGFTRIADLGCSIGGDALALSAQAKVIGIDLDLLRLTMAQQNVQAYGNRRRFFPLQADLLEIPAAPCQALFFDPARRDETGRRIHSVTRYQPPLNLMDRWRLHVPHAGVKISPGVDYEELPADIETEFISLSGEVKEAILWYGDLRKSTERRATLLPGGHTVTTADYPGQDVPVTEPAAYLYEPDGAVIRAHLVQTVARQLNATQIDPQIAYLTSDNRVNTPFARCFPIEAWFPFQLKRLRQYLRAHNVGQVTIKKRGSPLEPEFLIHQLRLRGDQQRMLFLTHVKGQPAVIIGNEIGPILKIEPISPRIS